MTTMSPRAALAAAVVALLLAGCSGAPRPGDPAASGGPDPAERVAALEASAAAAPDDPAWPFRIAAVRADAGDATAAEAALRRALALDPDHAPSLALLSKLWWGQARHDEAIALLESARDRSGDFPEELAAALALHCEAAGRVEEADSLVAALEPRVKHWDAAGPALAYLRLRGEGYRTASDVARRALEAEPGSAVNQNNWGIARLYAGDPVAARKAFVTALDLDPALPGPLYNLAIVDKFYFFDDAGARDWFRRYLALADDDPDGLAESLAVEISADTTGSAPAPPATGEDVR